MASKIVTPQWLQSAYTDKYLNNTISILAQRETRRDAARLASRTHCRLVDTPKISSFMRPSKPSDITQEQIDYYSVKIGADKKNERRNRYFQLEPYDRTRVIVGDPKGDSNSDGYLNASWVLEKYGHKWWIATQAPLPQTSHSFLSVLQQPIVLPHTSDATTTSLTTRVRTVVQLTQNVESGRRKAHAYFPGTVGKSIVVPAEEGVQALAFKVTLLFQETNDDAHCLRSSVAIVPVTNPPAINTETYEMLEFDDNDNQFGEIPDEKVIFTHLLYTSWPDHGVPEDQDRKSLVSFVQLVDQLNRDTSLSSSPMAPLSLTDPHPDPDPPIIVGCSAGVGRTGSFVALSSLMRHFGVLPPASSPTPSSVLLPSRLGPLPDDIKEDCVAQEIDSLREQRQRMVERPEQVVLIYEVLLADVFGAL